MSIKPPPMPPMAPSPVLQEALTRADEAIAYHDRRMTKRVRRLNDEPPPSWGPEDVTGVTWLPDPFPRRAS